MFKQRKVETANFFSRHDLKVFAYRGCFRVHGCVIAPQRRPVTQNQCTVQHTAEDNRLTL